MKSIFATILALFVFVGSIGAPFSIHTCYSMNDTEISFEVKDSCCSDEKDKKAIAASDCCDFYSTYLQVDFDALTLIKDFSFIAPVIVSEISFEPVIGITEIEIQTAEVRGPPIFYGRSLLSFVQSFLI